MAQSSFDVAVDAMGGDHAPDVPVQASLNALSEGLRIALVGDEAIVLDTLKRYNGSPHPPAGLEIIHAPESIGMDETPSLAVKKKRGSSVRVAASLVAKGQAGAMISAGNSGAIMAAALFEIGRIEGVVRPAIAAIWPTKKTACVVLDLGANIDPSAVQLAQFAVMGAAYSEVVLGVSRPKVALLANGSEEQKGTETTRAAHAILERSELVYQGYCEGRDVFGGGLDVIVVDGFTGNILLKTLEGFVDAVRNVLLDEVRASVSASIGAVLLRRVMDSLKTKVDYEAAGGAPLLGLKGPCIVAHGASSAKALTGAILKASGHTHKPLVDAIRRGIDRGRAQGLWAGEK